MKRYAQGGYIPSPGDGIPVMLSRGCTVMSYASYRALSPDMREKLLASSNIELVFGAEDVRKYGQEALRKLQEGIVEGMSEPALATDNDDLIKPSDNSGEPDMPEVNQDPAWIPEGSVQ